MNNPHPHQPQPLPLPGEIETRRVLKQLSRSHQALAELKGVAASMPNQGILIATLALQEAKDSSAIENIITTHDDLYQSDGQQNHFRSLAAKEVHRYAEALRAGFERVRDTGLITRSDILTIQATIEDNNAGLRKVPGTTLKNEASGEIIYTPPQHPDEITDLLNNLVHFINQPEDCGSGCDWDPLTRMAVIHHQFESIHPFYDGNGRTGRVLNILLLVHMGLLTSPVLYLSRYINQYKQRYYHLLQAVREQQAWEEWILFMLQGVEQTARNTTTLISAIKDLMQQVKHQLRSEQPKIYSQELINNLFRHPYTKIDFVTQELGVHRNTARKYLEALVALKLVSKFKLGKDNYYLNHRLYDLLQQAGNVPSGDLP